MWIDEEVGKVARTLRKARQLSPETFAQKVGETPENIEAIEAGRLRLSAELMFKYCDALHVPVRVFFEWQDDPADVTIGDPMDGEALLEAVN